MLVMTNTTFSIKQQINQKGFASIEATVLMVLLVSLVYYAFGFFGIIHTGIVHNIHSRTYMFETFRHRTNLMYFRSNRPVIFHYYNTMTRLHGINTDSQDFPTDQVATERSISMGLQLNEDGRTTAIHNRDIFNRVPASGRNTSISVNPVWIMTMYGMCLNSQCGG
jgi:hypothetical protein